MRWYAVLVALLVVALAFTAHRHQRLRSPTANVAIVSLLGPTETLPGARARFAVIVRDRGGAPVADAAVHVGLERNGFDSLASATTGPAGEAQVDVAIPRDLVPGEAQLLRAYVDSSLGQARDDHWIAPRVPAFGHVTVSTDKPEYRPGDTVHLRAILEREGAAGVERPATITVQRDGTTLFRLEEKTSSFGIVAADFPLAEQVDLAQYTVRVVVRGGPPHDPTESAGQATFSVSRRPRSTLAIAIDDLDVRGGNLEGTVRASYLSGVPVREGKVRVSVNSSLVGTNGTLDRDGRFHFRLAPEEPYAHGFYGRVNAEIERGGVIESTSVDIPGGIGPELVLGAYPESGRLVPGALQTIYVGVRGGDPRSRTARTTAPASSRSVSELGVAKLTIRVPKHAVEVDAGDAQGRRSSVTLVPDESRLAIHSEREVFSGTAKVTVFGASPGDRVVLQVTKGHDLVAVHTALASAADGVPFEIPLRKNLEGLVWLDAITAPAHGAPRSGRRLIMVAGASRDLSVRVTPDRREHTPRSKGTIDIEVTEPDGKPAKAELGLSAVDDAAPALGPQASPAAFEARARDFVDTFDYAGRSEAEIAALADAHADDELRGIILARLGDEHSPRSSAPTEPDSLARAAEDSHDLERSRTRGWLTIALGVLAFVLLAPFLLAGLDLVTQGRRPHAALPKEERDRRWLRLVGVSGMWTAAVLLPPAFGLAYDALGRLGVRSYPEPRTMGMVWAATAMVSVAALAEALRRVRLPLLLAPGLLLAHAACVVSITDEGRALAALMPVASDRYALPLLLLVSAQLVLACLGVLRIANTEPTTLRDRRMRFVKSASVAGLPITLGLLAYGAYLHIHAANLGWREFAANTRGAELAERNERLHAHAKTMAELGASAFQPPPEDHEPDAWGLPSRGRAGNRLSETRLWAPHVVTDEKGHAQVPIELADAITSYRLDVNAVGRTGATGTTTVPLVVKQDFFVDASLPAELTVGDELALPITIFAAPEGEDVTLTVSGDAFAATARRFSLAPAERRTEVVMVKPAHAGPRTLRVEAVGSKHRDAVERTLNVLPDGRADHDVFNATKATVEDPSRLVVKVYGSPLSQIGESLDGIVRKPHGCFEQTSSVTHTSLLALEHLAKTKSPSPSLAAHARENLELGVQRLLGFEVHHDGFSPFGDAPASPVLSAYAAMELTGLGRELEIDPDVAKRTRRSLLSKRAPGAGWSDSFAENAFIAWALASDPAAGPILDDVEKKRADAQDPYELALGANALLAGRRTAVPWLDALKTRAIHEGAAVRWESQKEGVFRGAGRPLAIETTALAAHALKDDELAKGAREWLRSQRDHDGTWPTTAATVAALRALVDDARPSPDAATDVSILVDGEPAETLRIEKQDRDVHRLVDLSRHARPGHHTVEVRGQDVAAQIVSERWGPFETAPSSALSLAVDYATLSVTLGAACPAHVRLEWTGAKPAAMPTVEIPIPPGVQVQPEDMASLRAPMVRRAAIEHGKVVLYLEELKPGEHAEVDVPFIAVRPGKTRVRPSRAYLYSEPAVMAQSPFDPSRATLHIQ